MKSGASDPFGDSEDERSESSDKSSGERSDPRDSEDSEPSERRTERKADRERSDSDQGEPGNTDDPDAAGDGSADPAAAGTADGGTDDTVLSRDQLPLVLRRERVKDERPEVHQLFVQRETHDRAVDAERALEDRLGVDLSRTDAREAIYLAGMAHLDDAEEILRTWGYDI
jgi:cobalamin biosynthesis protein CobT